MEKTLVKGRLRRTDTESNLTKGASIDGHKSCTVPSPCSNLYVCGVHLNMSKLIVNVQFNTIKQSSIDAKRLKLG